jgi:serine-type D-Ala-D-Ala carboxypeptidase/endopeptidase (penicillin-binding protein 4)
MRVRFVAAVLIVGSMLTLTVATAHAAPAAPPARRTPTAGWQRRIDALVGDRQMSVAIGVDGTFWYRHLGWVKRIPASNEKLLLSMALLSTVGPDRLIATRAMAAAPPVGGVLEGDLWIEGHGDPEVAPTTLDALASGIVDAGITQIAGSVIGDTGPFERDWWAKGWRDYFTDDEVPFPTALTFRGNVGPEGRHIDDPEARAAAYLTKSLRRRGVVVDGDPAMGSPRPGLVRIATVDSAPLIDIVRRMDVDSNNFDAEVLGKLLGAETSGTGSIARAAEAIDAYTAANGAPEFEHHDSSGLSYADRVTAQGMVRLLWAADEQPWAKDLRRALPTGGQGTLEERLGHLRVRAKTGTLNAISALSGWVWSASADGWVEFSIVSVGMSKDEAVRIEDAIVRLVGGRAAPPAA